MDIIISIHQIQAIFIPTILHCGILNILEIIFKIRIVVTLMESQFWFDDNLIKDLNECEQNYGVCVLTFSSCINPINDEVILNTVDEAY